MLVDVGLPLSLAVIMFSLGYGLTFADFGRVIAMPKAVLTGVVLQIFMVPAVVYALLLAVDLPPELAFGTMILSFCPGGVTSSILTKFARGTVALSITLTAIVGLISVLTVPVFVGWAAETFLGAAAPAINITRIGITMFAITAVPVLIGLIARHKAPKFAKKTERTVFTISMILFFVVVTGTLGTNTDVVSEYFPVLGPLLIVINLILLIAGFFVARFIGLKAKDGICISIELGVQNAASGITVASLVAASTGVTDYGIPSALYGLVMYLVTVPGVIVIRRRFRKA